MKRKGSEIALLDRCWEPQHGAPRVVGSFLAVQRELKEVTVQATDYYRGVVGSEVHGVEVQHGSGTLELLADADLAIITGMTLANNTLAAILAAARLHSTALVMFAETGANFAAEYCRLGIDVVLSEPVPFYLTGSGASRIGIYQRGPRSNPANAIARAHPGFP